MFLIRENPCNPWTRGVLKSYNPWTQPALEYDTYTLYRDDILDTTALTNIFNTHAFDVVVHLAATTTVFKKRPGNDIVKN